MPIVTTRCVVLQTYSYSDTSKILRLMTLDQGPRSAIARGALRPRSRFGGLIEPFAEGRATLYVRENRELDTLSDFDLVKERQGLGADLVRFAGASVLCELVMRLAPSHRDQGLYRTLVAGLDALLTASEERVDATVLRHLWCLVGVLGFEPHLADCLVCRRPIPPGASAHFEPAAGGLRCDTCGGPGGFVSASELAALRMLVSASAGLPAVEGLQRRMLVDYVRYHLAEGVRIRSLEFLARICA
ncbi:MAG: DNA repair protein RecO [Gemmatimonadetes bacterium]|nr:DNA repair protein RecO [Gemmatimonadota bacterium]